MTGPSPLELALAKAAEELTRAGRIAIAQAAMGWMFQGDLTKARKSLEKLPTEQLNEVAAAAEILVAVANAIVAERTPEK